MKAKITISQIRRVIWKVFSGLVFYSLAFLLIVLLLLQLTPVQTFLAKKVLTALSNRTNHEIALEKVKISWLDQASFQHILIKDLEGDTLVYSNDLSVNYNMINLIRGDFLKLDEITSKDLRLKLTKYDGQSPLNLTIFLNALKRDTVKKESKPIAIDFIGLSDTHLSLRDNSRIPDSSKLDFSNLDFKIPGFSVARMELKSDTINANILEFSGLEQKSGFRISELNTNLRLCNQSLSVDDLTFKTPTSYIADSLEFFYNGLDDFGHFVDSVSFILHFEKTRISTQDIRIITGLDQVREDITINGVMWGTVGDFNIEDTRFGYGDSYFVGGVSSFGLPNLAKTFVLADITDSHVVPKDLRPYIGDYAENLEQMGRIDFKGSFAGFLKDFVARGDFSTDQGDVLTDINLKIPEDPTNMRYEGNLEFKNLNVGTFLKNNLVQNVNLKAAIKGSGIKPENADFNLNALIYNSDLKGYNYDTVRANGEFAKNFFDGTFEVHDPNCDLKGQAQIDFRQIHEILDVDIVIEELNADSLNLTERDLSAKGHIDIRVTDLDLDDFKARLAIDSGILQLDQKTVLLDSIRFRGSLEDSTRIIDLAFPGFKSSIQGEFKVSDVLKDIPVMAAGYASKLKLKDDTVELEGSGARYRLTINAQIDNISQYLDSLNLPIGLGGKTEVEGYFRQSKSANAQIYVQADTLFFEENELHNPILEINGSEDIQRGSILTNFIFESTRQNIVGVPYTEDLLIEGIWYDNNIDITTEVAQPLTASNIRLESNVMLFDDSIKIKMLPSQIKLLDDNWSFNPSNQIVIRRNKTSISNFEIYDESESIAIQGDYSDTLATSIQVTTEDLNMNKVGLFSEMEVKGFLNGNFSVFNESSDELFKFDGDFFLKGLHFDDLEVGDVIGSSNWNPSTKSVYTKVEVERKNIDAVEVEGYYYPLADVNQLDFDIKFDSADLRMGEPFLKENFSQIHGYAGGKLKLSGRVDAPEVVGDFSIENGEVTINYLNTHYIYQGKIDFNRNAIQLRNFDLMDRKGSRAIVEGMIRHNYFKDLITDITIRANNFEFLNTTSVDNNLYYGSAYGTGTINVDGPLNDLHIGANIRTEANTRFFIPISEGTNVSQEDYITFLDFSDSTLTVEDEDAFNIKGLTLDFDIEVTPDAYCELIFDIKSGDIIRGRGRGNIKLRLDTDGDFNMFGPLEISEGAYNFTIPNLISKEFEVVPGSTITWYGDPYNAILNLDATYTQRASFEQLDNPAGNDGTQTQNLIPFLVVLKISGGMLTPDIEFDLQLKNESDVNQTSQSQLSTIRGDEQELTRQVISLLFLKRFSPRQSFTLSGGGTVGNSVSEFLSSQVSYLVSQIDENLEVEVNLADLNNEAFNTFQLRFAYTFLNGRLKVTRGGTFGNEDDNNDNVLNDIVGDWSVEYSLTKDGRLRAKVFRNTDQRIPINNENDQNQEVGISLRIVHSFNDLRELLTLKREEAILRRKEELEEEEEEQNNSSGKDSTSPK